MLHVLRGLFIIVCTIMGWQIAVEVYDLAWWQGIAVGSGFGSCCILLELAFARRFISVVSVLMFGVLVGFILSHLMISAMELIPSFQFKGDASARLYRDFAVTFVFSFLAVLTILHAKDDFKFVIPFIELKREGNAGRPLILDTSVIIDGRIADIVETKVIDAPLVVPRFVLEELQTVADSQDKVKRQRGRRGLDILNRMQSSTTANVEVQDVTLPELEEVDAKLIRMAKIMGARIMTNDFNLSKVAQVQSVDVFNINDLANAIKPAVVQGERLTIKILKQGENQGQGVGYLDDGTMVVAEECSRRIGEVVDLSVTNVLQTSAGRLIFAKPEEDGHR